MRFLIKDYGDTNFITGLRGLAATLVVVTHTSAFEAFGEWGQEVSNSGQLGVQAFFVIAGFTIAQTRLSSPGFRDYIVRRLLRIIPLYYAVVLICAALVASGFRWNTYYGDIVGYAPMPVDILAHFSFLSWLDVRTGNSIIGVEWTLPVEIFWYIGLLPFLKYLTESIPKMVAAFLFIVFVEFIFEAVYAHFGLHPWQWSWSPWQYGWYFALGAISWKLRKSSFKYTGSLQVVGVLCFFSALLGAKQDEILMALAVFFIIIATDKREVNLLGKLLSWRPFVFVGSVSYGLYLVHLPIAYSLKPFIELSWILFICTFLASIALAMVLAVFVENPLRRSFGKKLM